MRGSKAHCCETSTSLSQIRGRTNSKRPNALLRLNCPLHPHLTVTSSPPCFLFLEIRFPSQRISSVRKSGRSFPQHAFLINPGSPICVSYPGTEFFAFVIQFVLPLFFLSFLAGIALPDRANHGLSATKFHDQCEWIIHVSLAPPRTPNLLTVFAVQLIQRSLFSFLLKVCDSGFAFVFSPLFRTFNNFDGPQPPPWSSPLLLRTVQLLFLAPAAF